MDQRDLGSSNSLLLSVRGKRRLCPSPRKNRGVDNSVVDHPVLPPPPFFSKHDYYYSNHLRIAVKESNVSTA